MMIIFKRMLDKMCRCRMVLVVAAYGEMHGSLNTEMKLRLRLNR